MDFTAARKHMVDSQVRPNDVPNLALQRAMETVPREKFVPESLAGQAYAERAIPLFEGRWLLEARTLSKLIHAASIGPNDLVLDIGCGYGYTTAVLSHIAGMVVAVEEDEAVVARVDQNLSGDERDNEVVVKGALAEGKPDQGPYDAILIAGGVEIVPEGLLAQLKEGGRLATIVMHKTVGEATIFTRNGDVYGRRVIFETTPAGILPGFGKTPAFTF